MKFPIGQEGRDFRHACLWVERVARSLGQDCMVHFLDTGVSVAPVSWAGDSSGENLFDALKDASKHE